MNIEDCLHSLTAQRTECPYELLIVDTQSKDRTLEIASRYGARIISEERPGKSIARQKGAEAAMGEILCFTEADCQVPETWIETIVQTFKADAKAIAITGGYTFAKSDWFYNLLARIFLPVSVYLFYLFYGHHSLRATNFAIRTGAFREIGGFNTATKELDDVELSMRAKNQGSIRFIPAMAIQTLDRRLRNRLGTFVKEFMISFYQVCIRRQAAKVSIYKDIR